MGHLRPQQPVIRPKANEGLEIEPGCLRDQGGHTSLVHQNGMLKASHLGWSGVF